MVHSKSKLKLQTPSRRKSVLPSSPDMQRSVSLITDGIPSNLPNLIVDGPRLFLLAKNYVCANLVLVDCKMEGNKCVFGAAQKAIIVVGYNTFCDASWLTVEGVSGGVAGGSGEDEVVGCEGG
ncbi:hypothetical protein QJS10_CPB18g01398 [Acorus calamus]|uniref:Uncharacterized protein n=1 Tax=Acorus calamus TaxID=4465 RepID=A0AAV9CK94_ACOCL|nr:hypothetical protein QJS10_CPB18g01398 [Acorus calamus]